MFLCLILLASSILAPGQSAPSNPHQVAAADAAAAAAPAGHGQKEVYAELMKKMDEFVTHVLAPLFTSGKCQKGTKYENVHFGFDAFERRCESAVVLDQAMAELRKEFEQHKEEEELKEDVKNKMDELMKGIRDRVYYYDVVELEAKLHGMEEDFPASRVGELEEEVKKSTNVVSRQGQFEHLMEAHQKAMAAFQERPSFDTAYSLMLIASHSGYVSYVSWYAEEMLPWAMQTFKADLLVYDLVLKHEEEKKKKLEKKQSGHEHGPVKQEEHDAIVPHATKSGSKKRQDVVANV